MFENQFGVFHQEFNFEGWIVFHCRFKDGDMMWWFERHEPCGARLKGSRHHGERKVYCPKCDIWMPPHVADLYEQARIALLNRLPIV